MFSTNLIQEEPAIFLDASLVQRFKRCSQMKKVDATLLLLLTAEEVINTKQHKSNILKNYSVKHSQVWE